MPVRKKKRFIWIVLTVVFCVASFAGGYYYNQWRTFGQSEYTVRVLDVIDGDTIEIEWFGGVSRLRIVGIDTLETRRGKKIRQQAETWGLSEEEAHDLGIAAKHLAIDQLNNHMVTIRFPSGKIGRDTFGRLLAYVYIDGTDFGQYLVQKGLAYTRSESHARDRYYEWPMMQARNDRVGIHTKGR